MTAIPTQIDLTIPRTVGQILIAALRLFTRLPLLFIALAGIVVVPYELVVVLVSQGKNVSTATELLLALAELAVVNPCVAALETQALLDLGDARRPQIPDVVRRGLRVLPVVAAAEIVAGLCELAVGGLSEIGGLIILIIPAVFLVVRLSVVAPVAAAEQTDWPGAIRRSIWLTRGNFWRVLGLLATQAILTYLVAVTISGGRSVATTVAGLVLAVIVQSFCTLFINLLYFDLRAREPAPVA